MSGEGHRTRGQDGSAPVDAGQRPDAEIGRYRVVSCLGEGAMGMVYLAYDPKLDRRVALKVLRGRRRSSRGTKERQLRLRREARAMAQLNHPSVVTVHDVGVADGRVFLAMDYVPGVDLRGWLEARPRRWTAVLRTLVTAGQGLAAAHAAGVIHRDFKPENVLVGQDGSVKVMDFGLARPREERSESSGTTDSISASDRALIERAPPLTESRRIVGWSSRGPVQLTRSGDVLGTPRYMAPELFGGAEADAYSDQFAFCVTLYEALYGVRPFAGESMAALAFNMNRARLTPPPRGSRVPAWLGRVARRGLSRRPEQRHPSMDALLDALTRGGSRARLRRVGVAGAGLLLAGGGLAYAWTPAPEPCRGGEQRLSAVWNPERVEAMAKAFEATDLPYGDEAYAGAERRLAGYAARWVQSYSEVCEATAVHRRQTPEALDLRIACLDERRAELDALLAVLAEPDPRVTEHAARAVSALRSPRTCVTLTAERSEPRSAERDASNDARRARLRRAEALESAGRWDDAIAVAREVEAAAEASGDRRLHCEALIQRGIAEDMRGRFQPATDSLRQAYFEANEAGYDRIAARAAVALITAEGVHLARGDEGFSWARHAAAAFEREQPEGLMRGRYHAAVGSLHLQRFELDESRDHLERALELERRALGEEHEEVASLMAYLGFVYEQSGRSEDAVALFEKAIGITRRTLGTEHPDLATLHNNYATVLFGRRDLAGTQAQLERAVAIQRAVMEEHPATAAFIDNLGGLLLLRGEVERGRGLIEEGLQMRERLLGSEHASVANSLMNLAEAQQAAGDREAARRNLERARVILDKAFGPDNPQLSRVYVSLGRLDLEEGATSRGLMRCRRALTAIESLVTDPHQDLVAPLLCVGWGLLESNAASEARPLLERAYQMRALGYQEQPALIRLLLARALEQTGAEPERSATLRAEARAQLEPRGGVPERLRAWLDPSP